MHESAWRSSSIHSNKFIWTLQPTTRRYENYIFPGYFLYKNDIAACSPMDSRNFFIDSEKVWYIVTQVNETWFSVEGVVFALGWLFYCESLPTIWYWDYSLPWAHRQGFRSLTHSECKLTDVNMTPRPPYFLTKRLVWMGNAMWFQCYMVRYWHLGMRENTPDTYIPKYCKRYVDIYWHRGTTILLLGVEVLAQKPMSLFICMYTLVDVLLISIEPFASEAMFQAPPRLHLSSNIKRNWNREID